MESTLLTTATERSRLKALRKEEPDGQAKAREQVFKWANERMALRAEDPWEPLRLYLLYDSSFARKNAAFLEQLRGRLPAIHLVEMTRPDVESETLICRYLNQYLERSVRRSPEEKAEP